MTHRRRSDHARPDRRRASRLAARARPVRDGRHRRAHRVRPDAARQPLVPAAGRFRRLNQWLFVLFGDCPASLVLTRVFGLKRSASDEHATSSAAAEPRMPPAPGRSARTRARPDRPARPLGRHPRRTVFGAWLVLAVALGFFAPKVEHALSGAGWQATGSESVQVRDLVQGEFGGLNSTALMVVAAQRRPDRRLRPRSRRDRAGRRGARGRRARLAGPVAAAPGATISRDGRTAVVMGGAAADSNDMVRAADDLKEPVRELGDERHPDRADRRLGHVVGLQRRQPDAMMKSELISWPVTLGILVARLRLARRRRAAAAAHDPRPRRVRRIAVPAARRSLDISIWAMNFALMFALALGIDYALFVVMRFRGALFGDHERRAGRRRRRRWTPPARPSCSAG